ncbi:hypothetical protein [Streptomyces globosus]|uniref:hypothetical protein n=1 Tax=Streptomyces globosus TaxID=68209 RepID=UPI0013B35DC3|nr:hypothetical protein [Streptomyces globosus]
MSFHVIEHDSVHYVGPSEYDKADQKEALVLFQQVARAFTEHPEDPVGQVGYLMECICFPSQRSAPWAQEEMRVHLKDRLRSGPEHRPERRRARGTRGG